MTRNSVGKPPVPPRKTEPRGAKNIPPATIEIKNRGRFSFFSRIKPSLPPRLDDESITALFLIDIRDLFTVSDEYHSQTKKMILVTRLNPYLRNFFNRLKEKIQEAKKSHAHICCKLLVDEEDLEMGVFSKPVSEHHMASGNQNMVDYALKNLWGEFFDEDPYICFSINETAEICFPNYREQFPSVSDENIILLSSDPQLRAAMKNPHLLYIKPYLEGEVSQVHINALFEQLHLAESSQLKKIVWLDIDNTLLMRSATFSENKTILNTRVIELLKRIFPNPEAADICLITARSWHDIENDPSVILSVASIRNLLELERFNITKVIHTDFLSNGRYKVEFILEDLDASPGIHIFMEDNVSELLAAVAAANKKAFLHKGSFLSPVFIASDGMFSKGTLNRVLNVFERTARLVDTENEPSRALLA